MSQGWVSGGWSQALFSGAQRQDKRRKNFTLRVTEHLNRLPREVVESPSLEIFKTRLDMVLCSML